MKRIVTILAAIVALLTVQKAHATHALPLINLQGTWNGTCLTVNGSSDASTCSNDTYYMDVQIICPNSGFVMAQQTVTMGTKPSCSQIAYPPNVLCPTTLCSGTTFTWRARERLSNNSTALWMVGGTFTTPGAPPVFTVTLTASSDTICVPNTTTLTGVASGGCGTLTYEWSHGLGNGPLPTTGTTSAAVNPNMSTQYVFKAIDACNAVEQSVAVDITVLFPPQLGTVTASPNTICEGETTEISISGHYGDLQWQINDNGTWVDIPGATYTPYPLTNLAAGTYIYRASLSTACPVPPITTGGTSITVIAKPEVSVLDASACGGSSATLYAEPDFYGGLYTWIPGGATWDDFLTVSPTTTTTYALVYEFAGCKSDTAYGTVHIEPTPTVSVQDTAICFGTVATLTAQGSSPGGTYTWSNNASSQTINVTPTGTQMYHVNYTIGNCVSPNDTVIVTVNPLPVITIPDITVCYGFSGTLVSAVNTPGGNYTWMPGLETTPDITVSPTSTSTYKLIYSDPIGCTDSLEATVNVEPKPVVSIPDTAICIGDEILYGTTVNMQGGTFWWNTGHTTGSIYYSPTATTVVEVVYDVNGCQSDTAFATVTVKPRADISVNNEEICEGDVAFLELTSDLSGGTINWITTSQTGQSISVSPNNTMYYEVFHEVDGCSSDTITATVIVNPIPNVDAGLSHWICYGATTNLEANGADNYEWSTTETTQQIYPQLYLSTKFFVTGEKDGCFNTDSVEVWVTDPLVVSNSTDSVLCFGTSSGNATVTHSGGNTTGTFTYVMVPNPGNQSGPAFTQLPAGNYEVTVSDNVGCVEKTSFTIYEPSPLVLSTTTDSVSCWSGSDGTATATVNGGIPPYNYAWTPAGQTTPQITNMAAGTYTIEVTDAKNCKSSMNAVIHQPAQIEITLTPDQLICISQSPILSVTNVTGGNGNYTYSWSTTETTPSITVSPVVITSYTVEVTDSYGCSSGIKTINVNVRDPLSISAPSAHQICLGNSVTVNPTGTGGNGNYIYEWIPNDGSSVFHGKIQTLSPLQTTTYKVVLKDNCTNPNDTATVVVTVLPLPLADFSADVVDGCAPLMVSFSDLSDPLAGSVSDWKWSIGDPGNNGYVAANFGHNYVNAGSYPVTLSVTTNNGCTSSITKNGYITVYPVPEPGFVASPKVTTTDNPHFTFVDISLHAAHWSWDFDDGDTISGNLPSVFHTYTDSGIYCISLVVTSANQCVNRVSDCVEVRQALSLYIPNAFTPNSDGLNESFFPKGEGIATDGYEMLIFNRWGEIVFRSNQIDYGWNGKLHNGQVAAAGVYVYKITYKDLVGKKYEKPGQINLLR